MAWLALKLCGISFTNKPSKNPINILIVHSKLFKRQLGQYSLLVEKDLILSSISMNFAILCFKDRDIPNDNDYNNL